ncbi:thaumatin-like protein 1b [Impatiens glandulifera]|uniref:thaumatin-like protein 1b n=1 Tax=Impatiens glandulifera TaxID=253017 RepID=UPI001FB15AA6|nr:thaumatin-like protein 1b [Impatiens glandulifera]
MAKQQSFIFLLVLTIINLFSTEVIASATFTIVNNCDYTVWPGILSNAGITPLPTTGFQLQKGESKTINAPSNWGGRFWARTLCSQDSTGKFSCITADCGSNTIECSGNGAKPPATLAEFTLDGAGGMDFYDVSLVDGYNIPMLVVPQGGSGVNCTTTGCLTDLNTVCPSELKVNGAAGDGVACRSACEAFGEPKYCCSGAFGTPETCRPSEYSEMFKQACPRAYSYAYDDHSSTFTCTGADYLITLCPTPTTTSKKSSDGTDGSPLINGTMIYEGAPDAGSASISLHAFGSQQVIAQAGVVIVTFLSYWWLFPLL